MPYEEYVGLLSHLFLNIFHILIVGYGLYLVPGPGAFTLTQTFVPLRNEALKGRGSFEPQFIRTCLWRVSYKVHW